METKKHYPNFSRWRKKTLPNFSRWRKKHYQTSVDEGKKHYQTSVDETKNTTSYWRKRYCEKAAVKLFLVQFGCNSGRYFKIYHLAKKRFLVTPPTQHEPDFGSIPKFEHLDSGSIIYAHQPKSQTSETNCWPLTRPETSPPSQFEYERDFGSIPENQLPDSRHPLF